jgi:tetratricopeptide (TPR) repeat protein
MLARIVGGASVADTDAGVNAERALALMNEALGKTECNTAANYARVAIRLAKRENKEAAVVPKALYGLGQAYEELGRYYEATIAYEEVTRRHKDARDVAASCALGLVKCYQSLKGKIKNKYDTDGYESALRFLTDNYPNEGKGLAPFLLALQLQDGRKYDDASKEYEKVPADAGDMYDRALYLDALCRYLSAKQLQRDKKDAKAVFEKAEAKLKKALEVYSKDAGVVEDRKRKRKDLDAETRFLLADVLLLETLNKPKEVLPLLEKADVLYAGNADRLSRAGLFRVLAHLKLQALDAAEAQLKALLE